MIKKLYPPKYSQFRKALKYAIKFNKECPNVSVIINCHFDLTKLNKDILLLGANNYNQLMRGKKFLIQSDKDRKFIVFNNNLIMGKIK